MHASILFFITINFFIFREPFKNNVMNRKTRKAISNAIVVIVVLITFIGVCTHFFPFGKFPILSGKDIYIRWSIRIMLKSVNILFP